MLINSVNASTFGFTLSDAPGWLDTPPTTTPTGVVLLRGARALGPSVEQPRRVSIRGLVRGSSPSDARTKIDALKLALSFPPVQVSFADWATRYYLLRLDTFSVPAEAMGSQISKNLRVEITMTAIPPYAFETSTTTVAGGAAMAMGTGPVRPVVTLTGANNPVISLKDKDANVVTVMALTLAGTIVIDNDAMTILDDGVLNLNALVTGDFFVIDPADPKFQGSGPTINATGVSSVSTNYRKSWR